MHRGDLAGAAACFEHVLKLRPESIEACNNLGLVLMGEGRLEEAERSFRQVLSLRPELAGAQNNLGLALLNQGRLHEALTHFKSALRLQPDLADAHNSLGLAHEALGDPDAALACFEQAVAITPDHFGALANLGNSYKDAGLPEEAVAAYRAAVALRPDDSAVHSNLLLSMQYQSAADPRDLVDEARRDAARHADPLADTLMPRTIRPLAARRLRIGYVSADLREHALSFFLGPILAAHDRSRFEIVCYADVPRPDAVTERLRGHVDHWRSLVGLSDDVAAERIRRDEIDILVDLNGHTAGNRLAAFGHRPASIQVSYLGYLGTTGLSAIDYYLTDEYADPVGATQALYSEELIRLPGCGFCYDPGPAPEVASSPSYRRTGHLTFGCLNNPAKVTEGVLRLCSRVLVAAPDSRLLLATGASRRAEERFRAVIARQGVAPQRLVFAGRAASRTDYLRTYEEIDIALDPFPYNGVTTTCDALWMGVPVISLIGRTCISRQGVRFLQSIGLAELLADSADEYVETARRLAANLSRLEGLHSELRPRMASSSLMDAERLTRNLESAYLAMAEKRIGVQAGLTGL
jgi:predicted O-linked N-acetylglucosamine transferase (SPINDLY family)